MFGKKYKIKQKFKEDIEPEEILMDSERLKESAEGEREKLEKPIKPGVLKLFFVFIIFLLIFLFAKTLQLQIIKGDYWRDLADNNRIRSYPIKALRGIIYDRNKTPLAINVPKLDLVVVPSDLVKLENFNEIIDKLSQFTGIPKQEIEKKIQDHIYLSYPIAIKENLEIEKALLLESEFADTSAVSIKKNSWRQYEDGQNFSHVLGYLGKVNEEEMKRGGYFLDDYNGRTGLENFYEALLNGVNGEELVEIDNLGRTQKILATKEPASGNDLILSIDAGLQKKLYQSLKSKLDTLATNRAAAIALNPQNGKILALVSFPSFDSNDFIKGLSSEELDKIFKNKDEPLFNRAISGEYPSGSTIKPMIAAAALQEKVISPNQQINCPGFLSVPDKYNPNIVWTFNDWKAHGIISMIKAIAESCNVYFFTIGGGYDKIEGLGISRIEKYLKLFGWGEKLGIDLPGEKSGFIPNPQWKEKTKEERWYIGDTYNVSIGQGDITITPLQLAIATATIANGGKVYQPQLLLNKKSKILKQNFIKPEYLEIVRKGMRETVMSGSAQILSEMPIKVAGKTGTAQASGNKPSHGWFTAFGPYEGPEIVLTVLVEHGGGASAAIPVIKDVLSWYFSR